MSFSSGFESGARVASGWKEAWRKDEIEGALKEAEEKSGQTETRSDDGSTLLKNMQENWTPENYGGMTAEEFLIQNPEAAAAIKNRKAGTTYAIGTGGGFAQREDKPFTKDEIEDSRVEARSGIYRGYGLDDAASKLKKDSLLDKKGKVELEAAQRVLKDDDLERKYAAALGTEGTEGDGLDLVGDATTGTLSGPKRAITKGEALKKAGAATGDNLKLKATHEAKVKQWRAEGYSEALDKLDATGDWNAAIDKFNEVGAEKIPDVWRNAKFDKATDTVTAQSGEKFNIGPLRQFGMSLKEKQDNDLKKSEAMRKVEKDAATRENNLLKLLLDKRNTENRNHGGSTSGNRSDDGGDKGSSNWLAQVNFKNQKEFSDYMNDTVMKVSEQKPFMGKDGKTPVDPSTARTVIGSEFANIVRSNKGSIADADTAMGAALEIARHKMEGKPIPVSVGFDKNSGTWREQVATEYGSVVNVSPNTISDEVAIQVQMKAGMKREQAVEFVQANRDDHTMEQAGLADALVQQFGGNQAKIKEFLRITKNPDLQSMTVEQFMKRRDDLAAMRDGITIGRQDAVEKMREQGRAASTKPGRGTTGDGIPDYSFTKSVMFDRMEREEKSGTLSPREAPVLEKWREQRKTYKPFGGMFSGRFDPSGMTDRQM